MSRSESSPLRLGLIANLENRRVAHFRAALGALGLQPPLEVSWQQVLNEPECLEQLLGCDRIRIDSAGENSEVQRRMLELGGAAPGTCLAFGELAHLRHAHLGFVELLGRLSALALEPKVWLSQPADVAVMFDKWESHLRFEAAGLARPATQLLPACCSAFFDLLPQRGQWFLKPLHGSSASGVCAFKWIGERMQLTAPIEIERESGELRLFNSLRIKTFIARADITAILERLLPDGMIAEEWLPKARLADLEFDLRVVVIAGEARHVVVRQSRHPMTNLHLRNQRGDLSAFEAQFGAAALAACQRVAERAMACFPDTLYAGVDVLFGRDEQARVLEINAFGDLLPGVLHRYEDTATAILRAALERSRLGAV